jgi:hypothetical protein
MPAYRIGLARPSDDGWERVEVGNLVGEACRAVGGDPNIAPYVIDLEIMANEVFPTDACRNSIVDYSQKKRHDYLLMVDADAAPAPGTFQALLSFLWNQPEPSIAAVPYVAKNGKIQVFTIDSTFVHDECPNEFSMRQYTKDEAAIHTGFTRVASIGTHCMMIDMRVFQKIPKPFFAYGYTDDGCSVKETEDCYFCRRLNMVNIPIWCAWDFKAGHWKQLRLDVPPPIPPNALPKLIGDLVGIVNNQNAEMENAANRMKGLNGNILVK